MPYRKRRGESGMKRRSEEFGRLLKAGIGSIASCEGKTSAVVEEGLGNLIGVSADTIQRYKTGYLPPDDSATRVLAEAAVRRGLLSRDWLQRFLHAARYPQADKLLDTLCPAPNVLPRSPRVYENLPAATYTQFVTRHQAFQAVLDGLSKRSAAVLLVGLGGNGKTSLAREVAAHCLQRDAAGIPFDASVWVSDKDQPGTTTLSLVLDEVARTLDYPGIIQFAYEEKRREVEQLLRRQRVLLVIDNAETITDGALLTWLLNLPEPSKALITSRERHRDLWSSWLVELRGMNDEEALSLIAQRLQALQLKAMASGRPEFAPLIAVTGGNPKAIELTLGLVKYEHRPLQQVVDDLQAAHGVLFDDLFARAWALLDEAARRVLLVATFFPTSAGSEALGASADVSGYALSRAVERLADMALLDVHQADMHSAPRYSLHPLVRAFALAKLALQPLFAQESRERWVAWYIARTEEVGYCPDDLGRLRLIDHEYDTILLVMQVVLKQRRFIDVIRLGRGAMYCFYVRGVWDKWFLSNQMRLAAAQEVSDHIEEIHAVAYQIQMLSRQGHIAEAAIFQPMLHQLIADQELPEETYFLVYHCMGAYYLATDELPAAQRAWEALLERPGRLSRYRRIAAQQWLGLCLYYQGHRETAASLFQQSLDEAIQQGYGRYILFNRLRLAAVAMDNQDLQEAANQLHESELIGRAHGDREQLAFTQRMVARLHALQGDQTSARQALNEAIDLFERLGLRRELRESQQERAALDEPAAPTGARPAQRASPGGA